MKEAYSLMLFFLCLCTVDSADDRKCADVGGVCQSNSDPCDGLYRKGLCAGPATRQCCVPDKKCLALKGHCQNVKTACSGSYRVGLCAGDAERQCCVPGSDKCKAAGGKCQSANTPCSGLTRKQLCEDTTLICCLEDVMSQTAMLDFLKDVEGSRAQNGVHLPYPSPEGGLQTVGYGHKCVTQEECDAIKKAGGWSETQAVEQLTADMQTHYDRAKKVYTSRFDENAWARLSQRLRYALTDLDFNPGVAGFPKFMDAIHGGHWQVARAESSRSATINGVKVPLTRRNEKFVSTFLPDEQPLHTEL